VAKIRDYSVANRGFAWLIRGDQSAAGKFSPGLSLAMKLFMPSTLRRSVHWALLLAAACQTAAVLAQSAAPAAGAKGWIGKTSPIEQELKTATITRFEDIGTGVTKPQRGYLQPGGVVTSLTWKPLTPGIRSGYFESYKSEIAAYELDKILKMNMVPPAVEREVDGKKGAAIMWVEPTTSVKQMGGRLTAGKVPGSEIRKMQLFDNFIGNPDRNGGNILVDNAGNIILIDHSRAFVTKDNLPNKIERVDAPLWDAIVALDARALHGSLDPLIGDTAVEAMLKRRDRIRVQVDKLAAKKGRAQVLIPSDR